MSKILEHSEFCDIEQISGFKCNIQLKTYCPTNPNFIYQCDKIFNTYELALSHIEISHPEIKKEDLNKNENQSLIKSIEQFKCLFCNIIISSIDKIENHFHSKRKKNDLESCNKKIKSNNQLINQELKSIENSKNLLSEIIINGLFQSEGFHNNLYGHLACKFHENNIAMPPIKEYNEIVKNLNNFNDLTQIVKKFCKE